MGHPRWPGFNSKSGDPARDNLTRNLNRWMWRRAQTARFSTPGGRRRKKHLKTVEGGNLVRLYAAVYNDVAREQGARK